MPELSFVRRIAQSLYHVEPRAFEARVPEQKGVRGVYCMLDADEHAWVLRLVRQPDAF